MKKMAFTMTPRVLVWVTNSGNIQMDLEQGRCKFIVVELKLRFLRNSWILEESSWSMTASYSELNSALFRV